MDRLGEIAVDFQDADAERIVEDDRPRQQIAVVAAAMAGIIILGQRQPVGQLVAAESLGASRGAAIRDIMIPQIMPTALTALCLIAAVVAAIYLLFVILLPERF